MQSEAIKKNVQIIKIKNLRIKNEKKRKFAVIEYKQNQSFQNLLDVNII
jgi:hypothetical protein